MIYTDIDINLWHENGGGVTNCMAYRSLSSPVSSKIQAYANEAFPAFLDSISYVHRSKKNKYQSNYKGFACSYAIIGKFLNLFSM